MQRVGSRLGTLHKSGEGWITRCPAHDDRDPSLSVAEGIDGRVLLHCHAGCTLEEVLAALELDESDLFAKATRRATSEPVATYAYRDENGELLYEVLRYEPKRFLQRRPDGDGRTWKLGSTRRVLYRLPELLAAVRTGRRVFVVEGEKDVDALAGVGEVATCNPGGAGKWRDGYAECLSGTEVVIVADRDVPGRNHAHAVARSLAGIASNVRVVEAATGKDAADHLTAGHGPDDFQPVDLDGAHHVEVEGNRAGEGLVPARCARIVRMSDVDPEVVRWLWHGRIPLGKLTVLDGDAGRGKSTLMIDLAARATTGRPMPDEVEGEPPRSVVILTAEDGLADTVRPRLDAARADAGRVFIFDAVTDVDRDGREYERLPSLPTDLDLLERFVIEQRAELVIVDVLMAYLDASTNSYRDQDVRRALTPLAKMAERTDAAIVALRHPTKAHTANALHAGGGSVGIGAAARSVLIAADDPNDESGERRVLASAKSNLGPRSPALGYRLRPHDTLAVATIEWLGETSYTADDLMRIETRENRTERSEAAAFLREYLAEGPKPAPEIYAEAGREGITERTLRRAKRELNVTPRKQGMTGGWTWELPAWNDETVEGGHQVPKVATTEHVATFDGSGHLLRNGGRVDPFRCRTCGRRVEPSRAGLAKGWATICGPCSGYATAGATAGVDT